MHHHALLPVNSWKQQNVRADIPHPKLTWGDATGVSQQPKSPLGQLPLLRQGAGQCSEPQAGLCAEHRLCPVLHVPGLQTPRLPDGASQSPEGRNPLHPHVSTLLTRVAWCWLLCPDVSPAHPLGGRAASSCTPAAPRSVCSSQETSSDLPLLGT